MLTKQETLRDKQIQQEMDRQAAVKAQETKVEESEKENEQHE